jgi:hypothetical protein
MHRQPHHEVAVIVVKLELGRRRAILLHGFHDLWDASGAAFGEFQFFEELPDATVAIPSWAGMASAELFQPHRAIRPWIADDK